MHREEETKGEERADLASFFGGLTALHGQCRRAYMHKLCSRPISQQASKQATVHFSALRGDYPRDMPKQGTPVVQVDQLSCCQLSLPSFLGFQQRFQWPGALRSNGNLNATSHKFVATHMPLLQRVPSGYSLDPDP